MIPHYRLLPRLYRLLLSISRKHGLFTLARFHQRFFGGVQEIDIPGNASLIIPGDSHYFGFLSGIHERHVEQVIQASVRSGDVCIDIGANIGYFAMMMSQAAGAKGRVIAFEPVPETFQFLTLNAELARKKGWTLEVHQAAVSAKSGEVLIERQQHSTLNQVREADGSEQGDRVPAVDLSSFLKSAGVTRVALLKVDVEGHELSVLQGALGAMQSGLISNIIIEVTPGDQAELIDQMFSRMGAHILCWVDNSWNEIPIRSLTNRTDALVKFTS